MSCGGLRVVSLLSCGVGVRAVGARGVSFGVVAALVVSLLGAAPGAVAAPTSVDEPAAAAQASPADGLEGRPDSVSAMVTAQMVGERIEDLSQRTEEASVFANPDGTWTLEESSEAFRVEDVETGEWNDLDPALVERDGVWVPRYSTIEVAFSAGGDRDFVTVVEDGTSVTWRAPEALPEPVIEGDTATYRGAAPGGGDLVATANGGGFTHYVVLHEAPEELAASETADGEAAQNEGVGGSVGGATEADDDVAGPSYALEVVVSDGGSVEVTKNGSVQVLDGDGEQVVGGPPALMWDSSDTAEAAVEDETDVETDVEAEVSGGVEGELVGGEAARGEVSRSAPSGAVDVAVTGGAEVDPVVVPVPVEVEDTAEGTALVLTPDPEFLADPATVYPVTIDPSWTRFSNGDTWVQNRDFTSGQGASPELRAGTYNGGTTVARSYLTFGMGPLRGKRVLSANLVMRNFYSGSCTGSDIAVRRVIGGDFNWSTLTWANKPDSGPLYRALHAPARGYNSSCAAGDATWNLRDMVQAWADEEIPNNGVMVRASDESSNFTWRRYRSVNYSGNTNLRPKFVINYNSYPNTAAKPTLHDERAGWSTTTRPIFVSNVTDPDGGSLRAIFQVRNVAGTEVWNSGPVGPFPSGTGARVAMPAGRLVDGQSYTVRVKGRDGGNLESKSWSPITSFTVDTTPSVFGASTSCTGGFALNTWHENRPAPSTACSMSVSGAAKVHWTVNGKAVATTNVTGSSNTSPPISIPAAGYTRIQARAEAASGLMSTREWWIGTGPAAMSEPTVDQRSSSTFPIAASAPPGASSAEVQWRVAPETSSNDSGWQPASELTVAATGSAWSGNIPSSSAGSSIPRLLWDARTESNVGTGALVQVRVQFNYPGTGAKVSAIQQVHVVPSAFGGSFPTEEVGPGTVALATGEFLLGGADVEVPGYAEPLSINRSFLSMGGEPSGPAGVFGPGWVADFAGPEWGAGGFTVIDRTGIDGTIQLDDNAGETYVYLHSSGTRGAQKSGSYVGVAETALLDDKLQLTAVTGTVGVSHRLKLTEADGAQTTWVRRTTGTSAVWVTEKVIGAESTATTTYEHNADGTIAGIYAPAPVTCTPATQTAGCRALLLEYTGTGAAKRLSEIKLRAWNPGTDPATGMPGASAGMDTVSVAKYAYDPQGRLIAAWDPRLGDAASALKTAYTYTAVAGKSLVATITEPGLVPWRFTYNPQGRLTRVHRAQDPAATGQGGADATWTIGYDVPVQGAGLPDLSATATATWGQTGEDAPSRATAVFGPDRVPGGGDMPTPTESDYPFASLSYFNDLGRTTNTASFGAGGWQIDTVRYDPVGNVVWELDAAGRDRALAAEGDTASEAEANASTTLYNAEGTRVERTEGPMHEVVLKNGTTATGRSVTETVYDDEAAVEGVPTPGRAANPADPYDLAVEERTFFLAFDENGTSSVHDTERVRYRYDPVEPGDGDGWDLRTPTRVMVEDATISGGWATTITRFDVEAKPIEERTPAAVASGSSTDPRARRTLYYTPGAQSPDADCRNAAQWAGDVCKTTPAGPPSSGAAVPTTHYKAYSRLLTPTRVEETSGSMTRVTRTRLDAAERPIEQVTTLGTDTIINTSSYSTTTGLPETVSGRGKTETTTYDTWGRVRTQTDGSGNTATTVYDKNTRVATFDDGKGTYTYTYDGTDALGRTERRGVVTAVDVGYAAGAADTIRGAYDPNGALVTQVFPGGTTQTTTLDAAGNQTELAYAATAGGDAFLGYTQAFDHYGRVRQASGPRRDVVYDYDTRSRLTRVRETVREVTGDGEGEDLEAAGVCTTRVYGFTPDSNRASLTSYGPNAAGACQQTTGAVTAAYTYDNADRITTPGYTYDPLGRTLTVPKAHTDQAGVAAASNLTIGYHPDDMVASLQQTVANGAGTAVKRQDFALDASARISRIDESTAGAMLKESTHHYTDTGDAPAWTETRTRANASTAWTTRWDRSITDIAGGNAITQGSDGVRTLNLADLHGDLVATINLTTTGLSTYSDYIEYGLAHDPANTTPGRYGWLGTHQRENQGIVGGLTTMGARLYSPTTGRFFSIDPIYGGNDNPYTYPVDPINVGDLTGERARFFCRCGARPVRMGAWGERQARRKYRLGTKVEVTLPGTQIKRIFDGLTKRGVHEVKNVKKQAYTRQLRDGVMLARSFNAKFYLYVRRETKFSKPLREAIRRGDVHVRYIPGSRAGGPHGAV